MPTLLAIRGPLTGMRLELADETRIGRGDANDLVVPDAMASREHARIRRRNLAWSIEDLASKHGTFVNEQRLVGSRPLLRNDAVRIGESLFLFDSDIDIQNADYSDRAVTFAAPNEETLTLEPVAVLDAPGRKAGAPATTPADDPSLDLIVKLGELFRSTRISLADGLRDTTAGVAKLFAADAATLLLWDSAASRLRPSVALGPEDTTVLDASLLDKAWRDGKALLTTDRTAHRAPRTLGAPPPPAVRSVMVALLETDDGKLGLLVLERHDREAYSLVDLRNAQAVGRLMAVFLEARQQAEALALKLRFAAPDTPVKGSSTALRQVLELIARVAPTRATVLLMGETGTGKELLAREVHRLSAAGAAGAPFVSVNCSALPETLFESLVFGHEKGAFTGAVRTQPGLVEQANGGTLFLDEIGELSLAMQPKLLRFLQERVFTRVGGSRPIRAEVRLVCATNRDLAEEAKAGRFREDLYHRLSVMPVRVPPLRERRADIGPLAEFFLRQHASSMGRDVVGISAEALMMLERHDWPGNVRELSNVVERAVLLCDDKVLLPRHFQSSIGAALEARANARKGTPPPADQPVAMITLEQLEKTHIARVLAACDGNQVRAAEVLGVHRNTLRKKIEEYGLR